MQQSGVIADTSPAARLIPQVTGRLEQFSGRTTSLPAAQPVQQV